MMIICNVHPSMWMSVNRFCGIMIAMTMAVAGLLTEMEDRLDIVIEDEDVDGEMLESYGGLLAFAEAKVVEG